jgi:hypothetical protein
MAVKARMNPADFAARGVVLIAAAAVALFNGSLLSPIFDSVSYILYLSTRNFPLMTAARAANATQVVIALMTLLVAGIPAALYERIRGLQTSSVTSLCIWAVAVLLLTVPTLMNAMSE